MFYTCYDNDTLPTLGELIESGMKIYDESWTTYIPEHKEELIRKINRQYYFNEIGCQTPQRFIHYLNAQLERIMPYYNQLYASELLKFNPLINHYMSTTGTSVENLVSKANTSDDKFAKAIRDFCGAIDRSGSEALKGSSNRVTDRHDTENTKYSKDGTQTDTENAVTDTKEDETTTQNTTTNTTKNVSDSETIKSSDDRSLDRSVVETPDETEVKKMEWGQTEQGTEKSNGTEFNVGKGGKNWSETLDDDSTTKTVTGLTEQSSGSGSKLYSDTPQKALDVSTQAASTLSASERAGTVIGGSGNGNLTQNIRKDYLTNATWTDESSSHSADTTQDVTFADDQTKTHTETTTDDTTIDRTNNIESNKTKGGTDTQTTTSTGSNKTNTTETENTEGSKTRNLTSDTTGKETMTGTTERDLTGKETLSSDKDKKWNESGDSTTTFDSHGTDAVQNTSTADSNSTEQSRETANNTSSSIQNTVKDQTSTTENEQKQMMTGYMNVSASALLKAFRETFLNIDQMIIDELRSNFMLVY